MAKKESTFTNMVLTLFLVTLCAAAALGFVYEKTKGAIETAEDNKLNLAIKRVVPEFNNEPSKEKVAFPSDLAEDSVYFYIARKDSVVVGYAIETFSKNAFSGLLRLLAGFTPDGKIKNIAVLEHKETPGLGAKMTQPDFADQFIGLDPGHTTLKVKKDDGNIDAITASTITSRAYCEAVQRAYHSLIQEYLKKGGKK
jgi:electron transport complex protein RnfG